MSSAILGRPSVPPTCLVQSQWWNRLAAFGATAVRNRNPIMNQASVSQHIEEGKNGKQKDDKEKNNSQ